MNEYKVSVYSFISDFFTETNFIFNFIAIKIILEKINDIIY